MEAMACGLPSISTRLAGIPDIIEDGVSGILVEQRDAAALAVAIRKLAEDLELRRSLSRAGRQQIEREFRLPECLEPLVRAMRQRSGLTDQGASRP